MTGLRNKGFSEKTLNELKKLCFDEFSNHPAVYFVLYNIFINIEEVFEGQAMPEDLYSKFESLIPTIEDVLLNKDIDSLNTLIKSFVQIKDIDHFFV